MYVNITSDLESNPVQSPMEVGFWIWDFPVFKAKVQTIVELMGRKVKLWISSGKDSHEIVKLIMYVYVCVYIYIYIYPS